MGLALRIVKWAAFIVVFAAATSPRAHSVPDPSYLCIEGTCYRIVRGNDGDSEQPARDQQRELLGERRESATA